MAGAAVIDAATKAERRDGCACWMGRTQVQVSRDGMGSQQDMEEVARRGGRVLFRGLCHLEDDSGV